jgi:16S rRNA (cytidine1402-2'-O)-methyltransferase
MNSKDFPGRDRPLEPGTLYVVATPIGNLEDMTFRALRILQKVDLIAAEDTRHSRKLCNFYAIKTPMTSYFAHNEESKGEQIVQRLQQGETVALITDAGTPAISDPGYLLVKRCRDEDLRVECVPGPSAVVGALSISGFPSEQFLFTGFLPAKPAARRKKISSFLNEEQTVVSYESPRRLLKTLEIMQEELGGDRQVAVVRELTKIHEEMISGELGVVVGRLRQKRVRGEIVLLLAPAAQKVQKESVKEALIRVQAETGLPMRQVVKEVARQFGLSGSDVYRESLEIKE